MHAVLTKPYTASSVWTADELRQDKDWIYHLSESEIREIEAATEAVLASGRGAYEFDETDFPLPVFGARMRQFQDDLEQGRGILLIRGLQVDDYDDRFAYALYWGLACHLGVPITQNAKGHRIGEVKDHGRDYYSKNVRGYTTNNGIKAHCDSSDIVGLLCMHPSKTGGESIVASSGAIFNRLLETHPEMLETLFKGFHYDLRGEGATGDPEEVTNHRVPVFSYFQGLLSCRFNERSIVDGMAKAGMPLSGLDLEAVKTVGQIALSDGIRFDMDFKRGDIQLLNNHSVLHARTDFEDYEDPRKKRRLLRLWLNLHHGRPLEAEFAERLNTGPRGGVAVMPGA